MYRDTYYVSYDTTYDTWNIYRKIHEGSNDTIKIVFIRYKQKTNFQNFKKTALFEVT